MKTAFSQPFRYELCFFDQALFPSIKCNSIGIFLLQLLQSYLPLRACGRADRFVSNKSGRAGQVSRLSEKGFKAQRELSNAFK